MVRTKAEIRSILGIDVRKQQRLCNKLHNDLAQCDYDKKSNFMNDACYHVLKAYIESEKGAANYIRLIPKLWVARKLNITTRTLSSWIHKHPIILKKLELIGYEKRVKKFTKKEYSIIAKHFDL